MDALFSNGKLMPPAHPSCRCAVAFEEIEDSNLNPSSENGIIDTQTEKKPAAALDMVINPKGKVVWIVPQSEVKLTGMPDSITQTISKKGGINRNYYGPDGKQTKQISNNDHGHKKESGFGKHGEHAHDYFFDEDGTPHRPARELTDDERKENDDIL